MTLKSHALLEFKAVGWANAQGIIEDEMQAAICENILQLLEVFSDQGHSGTTAPYVLQHFAKLATFEPLAPLTGEDWEWYEHGNGLFQNKRCGHVFKSDDRFDGQAYDCEAVIFYDWVKDTETGDLRKCHYTCSDSAQPITFPYTPTKTYEERRTK